LTGEKQVSFRFWKRIRIAPGVTLNLSKSGGSISFGPKGAKFTIGPRGERVTVGLPGTGIFYTTTFSRHSSKKQPEVQPKDRLTWAFSSGLSPLMMRSPC